MRIITIATAALLALSSAALAETTISSNWSLDTEVKATHMVDAETNVLTINPEITYAAMDALDLTVGTTFNLWEDVNNTDITDEMDHMPVLELGATYALTEAWEFDASMNYDLEAGERSDIKLVASFSF
tara:strand:- start:1881 stop:2267 length:387 start_codon:yes stop_codon:yes gene_type:complete